MATLELQSRREIYQAIEDAPGVYGRVLLDRLDYAKGTLQYHLDWLDDAGLIQVADDAAGQNGTEQGECDESIGGNREPHGRSTRGSPNQLISARVQPSNRRPVIECSGVNCPARAVSSTRRRYHRRRTGARRPG